VPTGADASEVVAWYDFSALPGAGSNAVFSGHVTWNGRAVFWALDELQPGDTISVISEDGVEYTYEVFDNFPVDPSDPASLKVMKPTPTDTITVITCGGTWIPDPSEQFGGNYTTRTIVQAKLVDSTVDVPSPGTANEF
jgi:LPXTG-site transpeptidase (sortase) family protein